MPQEYSNRLLFAGKMDKDSDPAYVKEGEYTYALNLRPYNSVNSAVGVGNNIEGCVLVEFDFGVDSDTLKCVGSKLDLVRNRVYWFVLSDEAPKQAYVLYYDYKTKAVSAVFNYSNILGFDWDYQISDIDIVYDDEFGDTLLWVGLGEPRKLNVLAGYNRFNLYQLSGEFGVGQYTFANYVNPFTFALINIPFRAILDTSDLPEYDFGNGTYTNSTDWEQVGVNSCYPPQLFATMLYQKPITPYFSPNATYRYDNSTPTTALNIFEKSFEVCYKYVYFDGQESEWSPKSEAIFPIGLTSILFDSGGLVVEVDYDNPSHIDIRVPVNIVRASDEYTFTEQPHSMIARLKIAIREVPTRYAPNDWYQLANIPIEEFYLYSIQTSAINNGFPAPNTNGTYYYNWDTVSFFQNPNLSRVTTLNYPYDGSEALIPIDVEDASAIFYPVPKQAGTQILGVNRTIWGDILSGIEITKSVYDSIAENITTSIKTSVIDFSIEASTVEINNFTDAAVSSTIINSDKTVQCVFDMDAAFYAIDYETTFQYDLRPFIITRTNGLSNPIYNFFAAGTIVGGLTASGYADMEDFLQDVISVAFLPFSSEATLVVSFDEGSSQVTIEITIIAAVEYTEITAASFFSDPFSFYSQIDALPVRTVKNHTKQQIGFAFQDNAGRVSKVVTGEWAKVISGHFIDGSDNTVYDVITIDNISDISVPSDAKVMHLLKKRSGSYNRFIQFALSKGNCLQQSWNYSSPYYIGFLDLTLDEFDSFSFVSGENNLYITMNSMNGSAGGSYNLLGKDVDYSAIIAQLQSRIASFLYELTRPVSNAERKRRDRTGYDERVEGEIESMKERIKSLTENPGEVDELSSVFQITSSDMVRFLYRTDTDGDIVETYSELFPVVDYNSKWNTITINWNDVQNKEPSLATYLSDNNEASKSGSLVVHVLVEIISIPTQIESDFYWECAAQLSCDSGSVEISASADSIDIFGDVYMKPRGNTISYTTSALTTQNFTLLDMNYNDFYLSANIGEGRPNAKIDSVQKRTDYQSEKQSGNLIVFSEKSVQETDIRKYGTVYDINIQEVDNAFGAIEQLFSEGDKMTIYQEDKIAYAFLERSMTAELTGSERVISSNNDVISDIVYYPFSGGISRDGNTFAQHGYQKYFTDTKRGSVYRQSLDGITVISDQGMSGEFRKLFSLIRNGLQESSLRGIVYGVYDEYILHANYPQKFDVEVFNVVSGFCSFELPDVLSNGARPVYFNQKELWADTKYISDFKRYNISARVDDTVVFFADDSELENGDTIAVEFMVSQVFVYSEKTKGWSYNLSYCTEWASEGIQSYHTFIDGQMWFHNINNTEYNFFHGRKFDSILEVADGNQQTNQWLTVGVKTNQNPTASKVVTSMEMESSIPFSLFKHREGVYWAHFLRDENSTGGLYNGDYLKGNWATTRFVWSGDDVIYSRLKVFGVALNRNKSDFTV